MVLHIFPHSDEIRGESSFADGQIGDRFFLLRLWGAYAHGVVHHTSCIVCVHHYYQR